MRIAQVARFYESVPPQGYGSTERLVGYLVDGLLDLGHDVTLFASGDSRTRAKLHPTVPQALRRAPVETDIEAEHRRVYGEIAGLLRDFDAVHVHSDNSSHLPALHQAGIGCLTTLHYRLDRPHSGDGFRAFPGMPLVAISDAQRRAAPDLSWAGTVHHGLPQTLHRLGDGAGGYLAFLGRVARDKRIDRAVRIAQLAGLPLRVAAKADSSGPDKDYAEDIGFPLLQDNRIDFPGEIDDQDKGQFLGGAVAMLFPIDWPEPFGLVMIEAMACGTPVIAWPHGAVPEIVEHGVTGFIVESVTEAAQAVKAAAKLDRRAIRAAFDRRFTAQRMAQDYVRLFERFHPAAAVARPRTIEGAA